MRLLVLLDNKIDKDKALAQLEEYAVFFESNTAIKPIYWVERRDFSSVPTTPDSDGDLKPTYEYRQAVADEIHDRYGDYGVDHIVLWVHEDNFLFKGVWGTAWGYTHYKYMLELCRWDKDNKVNTFNTLFHENGGHPADTLIKKELGIEIDGILKSWLMATSSDEDKKYLKEYGFNYDRDCVHGGLPSMDYIGRKGYRLTDKNLKVLRYLSPYLASAYSKRKEKYLAPYRAVLLQMIEALKNLLSNNK